MKDSHRVEVSGRESEIECHDKDWAYLNPLPHNL